MIARQRRTGRQVLHRRGRRARSSWSRRTARSSGSAPTTRPLLRRDFDHARRPEVGDDPRGQAQHAAGDGARRLPDLVAEALGTTGDFDKIIQERLSGWRDESGIFSGRDFRDAVGAFATGINVITTRSEENGYGSPPTRSRRSPWTRHTGPDLRRQHLRRAEVIQEIGAFAVNVLSAAQEPLSRFFASKDRPRGRDAFRDVPHGDHHRLPAAGRSGRSARLPPPRTRGGGPHDLHRRGRGHQPRPGEAAGLPRRVRRAEVRRSPIADRASTATTLTVPDGLP